MENSPEIDLDQEERGVEPPQSDEYWFNYCFLYFMIMFMVLIMTVAFGIAHVMYNEGIRICPEDARCHLIH